MDNKHLGHVARKKFGQNFLVNNQIINDIVSIINPCKNDNIIEIGPGLGALTEPVVEKVDRLTVIELDRDLAKRLRHHPFYSDKLNVIESDVMNISFSELASKKNKAKVFGNLPYNISTPLIIHLLDYREIISEMHFMLQKEVVLRMVASPNSKDYGRLSLICQYYCDLIPVLEVPPNSFKPQPKVDSAVIRIIPKENLIHVAKDIELFKKVIKMAFSQRRKTLKNTLSSLLNSDDWNNLQQYSINPSMRAENLSLEQYVNITNYLYKRNS